MTAFPPAAATTSWIRRLRPTSPTRDARASATRLAVPIDFVIPGPTFTAAQVINRIDVAIQTATANKQIEQAFAGTNLWDGRTFSVVNHGRTYTFEYDDTRFGPAGWRSATSASPSIPGDPNANPVVPSTPAAMMAQRIAAAVRAAIPSAVVNDRHPRPRGHRGVRDQFHDAARQRSDRGQRRPDPVHPGTSAIRDITSYGLGFTLITNVEESYDIYNPDPRLSRSCRRITRCSPPLRRRRAAT